MSWLAPPYDDPELCRAFQPAWGGRPGVRALVVTEAIGEARARALRRLARPHLAAFSFADRGRYRGCAAEEVPALAELCAELGRLPTPMTGLGLLPGQGRLWWLARGDHALRLDDARTRPEGALLELQLDLSPHPCPGAGTVYSDGPYQHLALPSLPGQLSLVLRPPGSTRFDRYLTCAVGRRSAVLLRLQLPLAPGQTLPARPAGPLVGYW